MMALLSGIKFAGIFLLLACYMRGSKCYEIQENYEISNFSDILGRNDHHVHHHQERARSIMHVGHVAHQAINAMIQIAMEEFNSPHAPVNTYPMDCAEIQEQDPSKESGVYEIWTRGRVTGGRSHKVYCDMVDDGGGWTVFQRRGDYGSAENYFYRDWEAYEKGFGELHLDHWLGLRLIRDLTNQRDCSLKIYLVDWDGHTKFAQYDNFWLDDGNHNYEAHVSGYRGNAGDSFSYANGLSFTTRDRDNDLHQKNCAELSKGAWWYSKCHESNLNGMYYKGHHQSFGDGVNWNTFRGQHYSHKYTDMRVRPKNWKLTRQ